MKKILARIDTEIGTVSTHHDGMRLGVIFHYAPHKGSKTRCGLKTDAPIYTTIFACQVTCEKCKRLIAEDTTVEPSGACPCCGENRKDKNKIFKRDKSPWPQVCWDCKATIPPNTEYYWSETQQCCHECYLLRQRTFTKGMFKHGR